MAYVLGQKDQHKNLNEISILAPVRDDEIKREFSQNYLREKNISVSEKTAYSYNVGLWGTSIGGKETHTSDGLLPENAWYSAINPELNDVKLELDFVEGEPVSLSHDGQDIKGAIPIIKYLANIGACIVTGKQIGRAHV